MEDASVLKSAETVANEQCIKYFDYTHHFENSHAYNFELEDIGYYPNEEAKLVELSGKICGYNAKRPIFEYDTAKGICKENKPDNMSDYNFDKINRDCEEFNCTVTGMAAIYSAIYKGVLDREEIRRANTKDDD